MIDGINFTLHIGDPAHEVFDFPDWLIEKYKDTGEDKDGAFYARDHWGLDFKLKPSLNGGYSFIVNGSIHKYFNEGEANADQFTFSNLVKSISDLTECFGVSPGECYIHGLEIGVNIELPYSPIKVLKNVVAYRSRPFSQINKRKVRAGLQCTLNEYSVKVYDKEYQSGTICGHVLRFEISVNKMRVIKLFDVKTLLDLTNPIKVYPFIELLVETLNGIIWTDTSVNLKLLGNKEKTDWLIYSNPKTWVNFNKHQRNYALKAWSKLLHKFGNPPALYPLLITTWNNLFSGLSEAEKMQPFHPHIFDYEAKRIATFSPLECKVKGSQNSNEKERCDIAGFGIMENENITYSQRKCLTCGKALKGLNHRAIFCSEKLHGKAAKRCRNMQSNKRRNSKRLIEKALKTDSFLIIYYLDHAGETYADILHPAEIVISKDVLDMIVSIAIKT